MLVPASQWLTLPNVDIALVPTVVNNTSDVTSSSCSQSLSCSNSAKIPTSASPAAFTLPSSQVEIPFLICDRVKEEHLYPLVLNLVQGEHACRLVLALRTFSNNLMAYSFNSLFTLS